MSEELQISEHIYNNIPLGSQKEISGPKALKEFFSNIPSEVQKLWPLDLSDEGYKTRYEQAQLNSEQMGFVPSISFKAQIYNAKESYFLKMKMSFEDEKLVLTHESLVQKKGKGNNNFAHNIMKQSKRFLTAYDKTRSCIEKDDNSEIILQAKSSPKSVVSMRGGYVWANQGFDFRFKAELMNMREAFKKFLLKYGVNINDKDLGKFNKPCHFAAFGCGIQAQDACNNKVHLGKAFMLEQSWIARWTTAQPQAEEKRYAAAYNQKGIPPTARRRKGIAKLGKSYQKVLRKYYEHYASKHYQVSALQAYTRLGIMKLRRFMGIGRG